MQGNFCRLRVGLLLVAGVLAGAVGASAQGPAVTTAEYDNGRTTANNSEVILSPASVGGGNFGKVGSYNVDGQVSAQPLYVPFVPIGGRWVDVLYVVTGNNSVYAFDADKPGSAPLWQVNFGPSVFQGYVGRCPAGYATGAHLGILGTPVIDQWTRTMYLVVANPIPGPAYTHTLYAIDIRTGQQKLGGSQLITGSVRGTAADSVNGVLTMATTNLAQRPALLLQHGTVYVAIGGCGPDPSPYHGWVLGYDAHNIKDQEFVFNTTPDGDAGGIWQSGRGLVGDSRGSVYFETGNGTTDDHTNFAQSVVKLSAKGAVQDWFTPNNFQYLSNLDLDLSTTSPLLTPDTRLIVSGGKQGQVYVVDSREMGGLGNGKQTFLGTNDCSQVYNGCQKIHSMAYWWHFGPSTLYVWGTDDTLRAFAYEDGQFATTPSSQSTMTSAYPGGILTVTSAYGLPWTGIVWGLTPGELHAFKAEDVSQELWNSNQNATRDAIPGNYHFGQFTVVGGKVYVPDNQNHVVVYGMLN